MRPLMSDRGVEVEVLLGRVAKQNELGFGEACDDLPKAGWGTSADGTAQ